MKSLLVSIAKVSFALFVYSVGIALTFKADIGLAPWDIFHSGIDKNTFLTLGQAGIVVGLAIIVALVFQKVKFGIGTLLNMVLIGVFLDLILWLDIFKTPNHLILQILMQIAGLFIIALAIYLYICPGLGAGPRDSLMLLIVQKTKMPVWVCRTVLEFAVFLFGYVLGGKAGIGTVLGVTLIGPAVQIVFKIFRFDAGSVEHKTIAQSLKSVR